MTLKFEGYPIYALKFADLATQDLAGDRLSVFAEVRKGVVLPDGELRKIFPGYSAGKDFRMATVAAFFTAATMQGVILNVLEQRLLSALTQSKLLLSQKDAYTTSQKDAALISVAVPRPDILEHEFNHAVYFTEEPYRTACIGLWNSLDRGDREVFESLMIAYGFAYNFAEDPDLAAREFVAFFRATDILLSDYLPSIGRDVAASKPGDALYRLRPYFAADWRLTQEWRNRVIGVGGQLRELERHSEVYRRLNANRPPPQGR
ncbi:MAG: hypothetical protein LAQ69_15420 [Acidobacteriia bacterium]|nr:hypothetical protein [Terriglobia bacterium]